MHGLAGHDGAVQIRVEVAVLEETLALRVVNTIAPDKAHGRIGIGLANVRERLEVQFGERASFSAAATATTCGWPRSACRCCAMGPTARSRRTRAES